VDWPHGDGASVFWEGGNPISAIVRKRWDVDCGDKQTAQIDVNLLANGQAGAMIGSVKSQILRRRKMQDRSFPSPPCLRCRQRRVGQARSGRFVEWQVRWEGPEGEHFPDLARTLAQASPHALPGWL